MQAVLEPFLYEYTAERGGSISAEHGLGQMKNQYMGCAASNVQIFGLSDVDPGQHVRLQ